MGNSSPIRVFSANIKKSQPIGWLLLVGLLHGILFIFLIPPWQHYDEPGNFEYAWLLANQTEMNENQGYNQEMRREVSASMIEHDFYHNENSKPNIISSSLPVEIGISQTDDPSLYYRIVSLPLSLFPGIDITQQMYIARFVSLFFFNPLVFILIL